MNENNESSMKSRMVPITGHKNNYAAFVLGGCHAIIEVNEKMCGDPIEIAGLRGIHWSYDSETKLGKPSSYISKKRAYETGKEIMEKEYDKAHKAKLEKDVADAKKSYDDAVIEGKKATV